MKKYFLIALGIILGAGLTVSGASSTFQTFQGGTGTSSPYGILNAPTGATSLKTLTYGSGLSYDNINGTLNMSMPSNISYYLYSTMATSSAMYFNMNTMASTTLSTNSHLSATNGQLLMNWITPVNSPNATVIPSGSIGIEAYANETTTGNAVGNLHYEVWDVNSSGVDVAKIGTSESTSLHGGLTTSIQSFGLSIVLNSPFTMNAQSDRIVLRLYAEKTGSGTLNIYCQDGDGSDAQLTLPYGSIDASNLVPYTGAITAVNLGAQNLYTSTGKLGIGTTTPYSKLSVWGSGTGTGQTFELTNSASTTLMKVLDNGNLTLGTQFNYDGTYGSTTIGNLNTGTITTAPNQGIVTFFNHTVDSNSALGTIEGDTWALDSTPLISTYGQSLGDGTLWKNFLGFGTTTPTATFHFQSGTTTTSTYPLTQWSNLAGSPLITIGQNGYLGIATTSPATSLDVNGTITQITVKSCTLGLTTNALGSITGCVASDQTLKKNITPITSDINAFLGLKPVFYEWKDQGRGTGIKAGFIAQATQKVFAPAVVTASPTLLAVDPNAISALTVKTLQDLYKQVQTQQKQIESLQAQINALKK